MLRFTRAAEDLARYLLERYAQDPEAESYGLEAAKATGYGPGTVYPVFRRMTDAHWLLTREEDPEAPATEGRPPRIYYRVNPEAVGAIRQRLAEIDARRRATSPRSNPAPSLDPAPATESRLRFRRKK
ncbi:hypothetical protein [Streptomyces sp. NPDC093984]|uniref:hypothetical protein n=1 Tax=Streptomyces sp. NPDC093984 TaxID=3366052 RepID=UPI003807BCF6